MLSLLNPENLNSFSPNGNTKSRSKSRDPTSSIISNYEIKQRLGRGSYAKVYKAVHLPTSETVAVKVFNKSKMTKEDISAVHAQVQVHKKLLHTNIARIYELYENEKRIYIFMEYCQNGELFNYINSRGPLSEKKAGKIFKQILSAMKYLKSQRVFHRDIKCENILFDKNWNAKLVDFGFATKQQDDNFSRTFCGSPSYTAPELFTKPKYKAETVDIWCLGVTFYAMLQGCLPFDGKEFKSTKKNIIQLKYGYKNQISSDVKQIFDLIFVEDSERATIQTLEDTNFVKNALLTVQNFINTDVEEISIDCQILKAIESQFPKKISSQIVESVTQFKMDSNYSLYYLMIQNAISKGKKVKFDISSQSFEKRKKKVSSIRLRKLSDNYKKISTEIDKIDVIQSEIFGKKVTSRIRPSLASIEIPKMRRLLRNNSLESPSHKGRESVLSRKYS